MQLLGEGLGVPAVVSAPVEYLSEFLVEAPRLLSGVLHCRLISMSNIAVLLVRLVKTVLLLALFATFFFGLQNAADLVEKGVLLEPKGTWQRITITENQATVIQQEKDTDDLDETGVNHAYTNDASSAELCIRQKSEKRSCVHVHFRQDRSLPSFLTADYLVLQNQHEFLVVERHQPSKDHHLQHFTQPKEAHLKHAHPQKLRFHAFNNSNLFVYESDRLYITYLIENRNIKTCLFLEKVDPTYKQYIFPRDSSTMLVVSLPKRKQLMSQLFNFRDRRVLDVNKYALQDWVKNYDIREEQRQQGKVLVVSMEMAGGTSVSYTVDFTQLTIAEEQRQARFSASIGEFEMASRVISVNSRMKTMVFQEIQSFFWNTVNTVRLYLNDSRIPPKDVRYEITGGVSPPLKFSSGNKLVSCQPYQSNCAVVSLGKYLIPTTTPVFHDQPIGNFDKLQSKQLTSQKFTYIENGVIHSEDYLLLYEIHPKTEVEWVGLTQTFIHFFPYNKDSKNYRFARTDEGGLVFEGSNVKGRWLLPYSSNEVFQQVTDEGIEVVVGVHQAHVYWYGLFSDMVVVSGKVIKVRVLNGFTGKPLRVFTIKGQYIVENVYLQFLNNELFICLYDPQQDRSLVTKVEFYTSAPENVEKEPQLNEIQREYTIYSKIHQIRKVRSAYYLYTFSYRRLSLLTVSDKFLNNRRQHLYQKQQSAIEKRLTTSDVPPFDNILDVYGVVVEYNHTLSKIALFEQSTSRRVYCVMKQQDSEQYLIVDMNRVIKNRFVKYRYELRLYISIVAIALLPLVLALMFSRWKKQLERQAAQLNAASSPQQKQGNTSKAEGRAAGRSKKE